MNPDIKQTCILIPGMHRSGTSALTGTLGLLDVYLGKDLMPGNFANKKGYFENTTLFKINESVLSQINSSWDDVFFDETKPERIKESDELQTTFIHEFQYAKIFAVKDPRLVYLFPLYEKILQELKIHIKIILPYRNPVEVANSLHRRDNMPMEKGMLLWVYNFLLAEKLTRDYDRIFVNFDELITNTSEVISQISSKLSIPLAEKYKQNQRRIDEFLEPGLKNHNLSIENLSAGTPKIIKNIISLRQQFNDADNANLTTKFDALREELFSYKKLFYNKSIVSSLTEGETARQTLQAKEQILQTKEQTLQTKEQELNHTKQILQAAEETLQQKNHEFGKLKTEVANLYTSRSWKLTRPFRTIMNKLKKIRIC
jgi:hypothetical protein